MQIENVTQGSAEWHAYRRKHFNASDAPAMMGCSPYKTRAQLLHEMSTGIAPEVDKATQRRFDDGHRFEALARPLAEKIIGDDLYPVTGSEGRLSASFDGITLGEDVVFEHKTLNEALRAAIRQQGGNANDFLPLHYRVQLEQQLMVSGACKALFMATKWASDNVEVIEDRHCWYAADPDLRAKIVAGWEQFERDLDAYVPPKAAEPARAEPMDSLPAVSVRLDGALSVVGNLPSFAEALRAFIARIPAKPATDNEFATCDAACKALKKAEEALDAAEAGALASITDVEAMRRAVADCRKLARDTRLAAEKLVDRRKTEIKEQAVMAARAALDKHIADLNGELAPMRLQPVAADFAGAIKGLRSITSLQDALDTTLAQAKIAADTAARLVRTNATLFREKAEGLEFLFSDLGQLIHKAPDDFALLVQARVDAHRAAEARRLEAERERIRAEETAKSQRDAEQAAAAKAEHDRMAAEAIAKASQALQVTTQPAASGGQVDGSRAAESHPGVCSGHTQRGQTNPPASPIADEPATLKLGVICERLGFTVTAQFLADVLHVPHRATDKAAKLYRESDWPLICKQLVSHVGAMAELYEREAA